MSGTCANVGTRNTGPCPNRNYCDPSVTGCGDQNRGHTWFYTDQARSCDCADTCFGLSMDTAQTYCNNNASNYGGGTFCAYCYETGTSGGCTCESNYICIKEGWNEEDKLPCCLGTLNDVIHCAPSWCPTNVNECADVLAEYCSRDPNVATNPTCVDFCSRPENKGLCDQPMRNYCAAHPEDPLCACISSHIPAPSCYDANCTQNGYQTADMVRQAMNCGAFCGQFIDCVNAGNCTVEGSNFTEYCDNNPGPSPGPSEIPAWLWIVLGIVGIIVILIVIYLLYRYI